MLRVEWSNWPILAIVVLIFSSSSCASVDYGLYRIGATEEDFRQDEAECRQGLGLGAENVLDPTHILIFLVDRYKEEIQSCLQEKGWKPRP